MGRSRIEYLTVEEIDSFETDVNEENEEENQIQD